jgi:hypothetical protein
LAGLSSVRIGEVNSSILNHRLALAWLYPAIILAIILASINAF